VRTQTLTGLSIAAVTLAAFPAMAQVTGTVEITGNASAVCSASGSFAAISVGDMLNKANGGLDASKINNKTSTNTSNLFCNGVNSTLQLVATPISSTAALPAGAGAAGFANTVEYTATATLSGGYSSAGPIAIADTTTTVGAASKVGLLSATAGQLVVTLSDAALPSGKNFLMADPAYAGSVTLTLAPVV
jgi:hypothetical protein